MIDMRAIHSRFPHALSGLDLIGPRLLYFLAGGNRMIAASGERRCHRCQTRLARDNTAGYCAACQVVSRDRFATPLDVPAEFWEHPALKEAFAARHMGRVIRAYRCHPFHGRQALPQAIVAQWLGVTQGQLSRIEKGAPIVHLDRLIYWARVLRMPSALLWFSLPEDSKVVALAAPSNGVAHNDLFDPALLWAPADTIEIVSQF